MNLLAGLFNAEGAVKQQVPESLKELSEEFNLQSDQISLMIQPINGDFEFKVYAIKLDQGRPVGLLREVPLSEIVG